MIGKLVGGAFVAMAAIPIVMGAVIFAPVVVPLAVGCVLLENNDKKR